MLINTEFYIYRRYKTANSNKTKNTAKTHAYGRLRASGLLCHATVGNKPVPWKVSFLSKGNGWKLQNVEVSHTSCCPPQSPEMGQKKVYRACQ
jgi:hypothetical protein